MNELLSKRLLELQLHTNNCAKLSVVGNSMYPTLKEGDIITISAFKDYAPGDILVFLYKHNRILVHRLVFIDKYYFCKGDNSLRLEDISFEQILGRVVLINAQKPKPWSSSLVDLSYRVNRMFVKSGYNYSATINSNLYQHYRNILLERNLSSMIYQANPDFEYIKIDETSFAAFDPKTRNTFFFNESGMDIIQTLKKPITIEHLLNKLSSIYNVDVKEIKGPVREFLSEAEINDLVLVK